MLALRHAFRRLASASGTTLAIVLLLGLSVGGVTSLFAVIDAFALRPLPLVEDSRELVRLSQKNVEKGWFPLPVSEPNFEDWRRLSRSLEDVVAVDGGSVNLTGAGMAQRIRGARVSPAFFELLGTRPALGRTFLESDLPSAHEPSAVISHALWSRVFGADPDVVGEPLRLDGEVHVVVGVMAEGFNFPPVPAEDRTDVWIRYEPSPAADRGVGRLSLVFGRLRDGVSMEQAGRELDGIAERLAAAYPDTNADVGIAIEPARFSWGNPLSTLGPPVVGASILILLLAGANVAGLLMIRQRVRREELAVRTALGASRFQLLRQVLLECLLLGFASAVAALLASFGLIRVVAVLLPSSVPLAGTVQLDARTASFSLATTVLVVVLIAFLSSLGWRPRGGARALTGHGGGRARWSGLRRGLLVAETAIALVAVVGTGLFVRSLAATLEENPGFEPEQVLTAWTRLPSDEDREAGEVRAFYRLLLERLDGAPGVGAATLANSLPLVGVSDIRRLSVPGSEEAVAERPMVDVRRVTPGYFRTLGVPLLRGRLFGPGAEAGVALVNQAFADRYLGGDDALGRTLRLHERMEDRTGDPGDERTVIGLVGNEKFWRMDLAARETPQVYVPDATNPSSTRGIALKADGIPPESLTATLRSVLGELDPQMAVYRVSTLEERMASSNESRRATTAVMTLFGFLALVLAAAGLYAVLAQSVVERRSEVGVRMALGAQIRDVVSLVVREGLFVVGLGLAVGLGAALLVGRGLRSSLYGVESTDPASLLAASLALLAATLLATLGPARRAARTDPVQTLRQE